ncbi:MAG TPA: prepilin-type N-terminal cleavage/methylation domain-containing protein [Gemmatimonadales bacterium]|nr:prepilin-type N-terminal cleavage/methylation domain-containing protein [Gemmatimonadales bacterium]
MLPEDRGLKPRLGAGASLRTRPRAEPALQGRGERGFTLIEILIALAIGAFVVLVAHELFASVAERGRTLTTARLTLDRSANARRWLAGAFLSLDVGTEGAGGFEGRPDHVAFSTWLLTPDGWFERRTVSLARDNGRLVASVPPGEPVSLTDSVADLAVDYLLEPGAESRWVREWVSPVSAPLAVRLRIARTGKGQVATGNAVVDTLLFLIKERG